MLKIDPEAKKHSAALTLLGEIALQQDDLDLAIVSFNKALIISPHHWSAINNLAYAYQQRAEQYFAQSDAKKGLDSRAQEVYPRYQEAARLDAEIITPHIELKRLKALLELPSGQVNLQVENLISQIETDQLQWLVNYFQPEPGSRSVVNKQTVKTELAKIQNTSIGGKMNLPRFLYNDLISLKRYHPKWIRKIDIAQKHALLLTIVQR